MFRPLALLIAALAAATFAATAERPRLHIINGSAQPAEIFWLKNDSEAIPNGTVPPGQTRTISTTLGHRFAIVGPDPSSRIEVTSRVLVQAFRFDPEASDGIPAFYTQRVSAGGYPIVASAHVNPYALKEAAYLVDQMLAQRPDLREAMILSGSRMCILAHDEFTTDQPEFTWLGAAKKTGHPEISGKDYVDARSRGTGGSESDPYCTTAEENLLGYPGDPYSTECILIHEFAHNIHLRGMANIDPTFDRRLAHAYAEAMARGLWTGKYASVNRFEYFAEGVQCWFDNNRFNDHDHNHVHLRSQLLEYDPGLAALCAEVFGDTVISYTKPHTRLTGHLAGYDPTTAPRFVWPARLAKAKEFILRQARERDEAANGAGTSTSIPASPPHQ